MKFLLTKIEHLKFILYILSIVGFFFAFWEWLDYGWTLLAVSYGIPALIELIIAIKLKKIMQSKKLTNAALLYFIVVMMTEVWLFAFHWDEAWTWTGIALTVLLYIFLFVNMRYFSQQSALPSRL